MTAGVDIYGDCRYLVIDQRSTYACPDKIQCYSRVTVIWDPQCPVELNAQVPLGTLKVETVIAYSDLHGIISLESGTSGVL